MGIYIVSIFSFLLFVFLISLTIQLIRIEKTITDTARLVEEKVKKLFQSAE